MNEEHKDKRAGVSKGFLVAMLLLVFGVCAGVGAYYYHYSRNMEQSLDNQYNRAFEEVVNYVRDIDVSLNKGKLISSSSQMAKLSTELFMEASEAKSNLGQLPISQEQLKNASKFLSQVGDYTYMLSQKSINSQEITNEEYDTLLKLSTYAGDLYDNLSDMQDDLYKGNINFRRMQAASKNNLGDAKQASVATLTSIEKEFQNYPSLIYDGPFSEHIEKMEPVMLKGKPNISMKEAKAKVADVLKEFHITKIESTGESQNTVIPTYAFSIKLKESKAQISVEVSKSGGYLVYMLSNTSPDKTKIKFDDASKKATAFLGGLGLKDMKQSYYEVKSNVATINFAYMQGNTIIYPDLIKVKVSMQTGAILGFESQGYLMSHLDKRDLPTPKLTMNDALAKINQRLVVQKKAMAVIPTDSKAEVLCYEFTGYVGKQHYIIYVNAVTGAEQKILLLLENKSGVLTM